MHGYPKSAALGGKLLPIRRSSIVSTSWGWSFLPTLSAIRGVDRGIPRAAVKRLGERNLQRMDALPAPGSACCGKTLPHGILRSITSWNSVAVGLDFDREALRWSSLVRPSALTIWLGHRIGTGRAPPSLWQQRLGESSRWTIHGDDEAVWEAVHEPVDAFELPPMVHHPSVLGSREVGMCCAVCVCVCFSMHFFVLLTSRRCARRPSGSSKGHASSVHSLKELLPETLVQDHLCTQCG